MSDNREIVDLLKEIRDIQSERLVLQKKALADQEVAQNTIRSSLAMQRTAAKIQKFGMLALLALVIWMLYISFR